MRKLLLLTLILVLFVGCAKIDFENVHVVPNTSFPVGKAYFTDSTLFAFGNLQEVLKKNEDDVLVFNMTQNQTLLNRETIGQLIQIRSQVYDFSFDLSSISGIPGLDGEINLPEEGLVTSFFFNAGSDGEEINKLIMESGAITFKVFSDKEFPNLYGYFPQITRNGQPIVFRVGDPIVLDESCIIAPVKKNGQKNVLELVLKGSIPVVTNLSGEAAIIANDLNLVEGWFGRKVINPIATEISLADEGFSEFLQKTDYIYFADPKLEMVVENNFNLPILIELSKMDINGREVGIKSGLGYSKFVIEPLKKTRIKLSNASTITGSGFSAAFTKDINKIAVEVSAIANPTKADVGSQTYVEPTVNGVDMSKSVGVESVVEVPFNFIIQGVKFDQDVDIDLKSLLGDGSASVQEFALALSGTNEMPIDLVLKPYIKDGENGVKEYLFSEPIAISGTNSKLKPNSVGFEPFRFEKENRIVRKIDQDMIGKLLHSSKIFFEFSSSTVKSITKNNPVKLYSPSKVMLNVSVGLKADLVLFE